MEESIVRKLVELNLIFYETFADSFSASRSAIPPGYAQLLPYLPSGRINVLDIGCGNGRFGRFLEANQIVDHYTGVDYAKPLLAEADYLSGQFLLRDLSRPFCLAGLGTYELIVALSTLQHIPGRVNRDRLLREMADHLAPDGLLILGNWQFLDSPRQQQKIRPWSEIGIDTALVETGDYLLSWQRGGYGVRYVASLDQEETRGMAERLNLRIVNQFRNDGREGNLNLYTILAG